MQPPPPQRPGALAGSLLNRILEPANLAAAWEAVAANGGVPGVDELRISRYGRHWEERVTQLAEQVRAGQYRTGRLRTRFIPKASGGQRRISIPTVTDRVLQRATLQVLLPRLDRKFLGCSYGYRPKRGVAQAVADIVRRRDRGFRWLLEADIDDCFGSLDHTILLTRLRQEVREPAVLRLMEDWLAADRPNRAEPRGIALGMPISPLWANLYLHELDWQLTRNRWPLVRYADDFVVLAESPAMVERAQALVEQTLATLKLRLEPTKTGLASFDEGFEFLGVRFKGDDYTFTWQEKRITVTGRFNWLWGQHISYNY